MSISDTKELAGRHSVEKNRGIMRFPFLRPSPVKAFVTDLDTVGRFYSNRTVVPASMRRPERALARVATTTSARHAPSTSQ